MSILAEEIVEEWLNRHGYFTIRGIKLGVDEIDLLAIKPKAKGIECRHIEVHASMRPVAYVSKVPKEDRKKYAIGADHASERPDEQLERGVDEWVENKFRKVKKKELRQSLCKSHWSFELVVNKVRDEKELLMIKGHDVKIIRLKQVMRELKGKGKPVACASGGNLVELVQMGKR